MAKMSSRLFSRRQRDGVRAIAKRSLELSGWDEEQAKQIAETAIRREYGSIWVVIAISIAFKLIEWWLRNRRRDPQFTIAEDWQDGEPGRDPDQDVMHVDEPSILGDFE
jgi:hypothetical protein